MTHCSKASQDIGTAEAHWSGIPQPDSPGGAIRSRIERGSNFAHRRGVIALLAVDLDCRIEALRLVT